jgi:hypothetical protein
LLQENQGYFFAASAALPTSPPTVAKRIARGPAVAVSAQPIAASGTEAWLPKFGLVRVFRVVAPNGDTTHWGTNDLGMAVDVRRMFAELSWGIEEYHRGLKQFTGVERCPARAARSQRNHIGCALRAFVRLEYHRFTTGVGWFAAKWGILREAARAYLTNPTYLLPHGSTAQLVFENKPGETMSVRIILRCLIALNWTVAGLSFGQVIYVHHRLWHRESYDWAYQKLHREQPELEFGREEYCRQSATLSDQFKADTTRVGNSGLFAWGVATLACTATAICLMVVFPKVAAAIPPDR